MSPTLKLVKGAATLAKTADDIGARFARELGRVLRDLDRKLRPLVTDAAGGSRTALVKAAQAGQLRQELRTVLTNAGFDALASAATDAPLDTIAARVLRTRRLAQQSAALVAGSVPVRLAALKALHFEDLLLDGDDLSRALWQATVRGIFGSRAPEAILADLAAVIDDTEAAIRTLYDTGVSIFGRQVEAIQAGDDPATRFAYFGPIDEKVRPFCLEHVGKVYARAEIDALDNGQIDNVFLTGGGYNCRHQWMEVSKFSELYHLKGRVPEMQQQLRDLEQEQSAA